MMTTVLVTGANGFVGRVLCAMLLDNGYQVKAAVRSAEAQVNLDARALPIIIGDIHAETDWQVALVGVDVVIHLAARVHVMRETAADADLAFRCVNTDGTENLAKQAAAAGVKRLVFLSSIKVLGESAADQVFDEKSPAAPQDAYARSKWAAEQMLQHISVVTGLQVVVIRTPLVYGAGVKGNFLRLMQLIKRGWPLPFACIQNQRSLVYVENLCGLLGVCVDHPAAAGQTLLVADSDAYSTPELMRQLANALNVSVHLLRVPVCVLKTVAGLFNKQAEIARLCDSLQVDATYTFQLLNWQPPYTASAGLAKTATAYLASLP